MSEAGRKAGAEPPPRAGAPPALDRRRVLGALFGASGLGLRALATGLPLSFLARPLRAQPTAPSCAAERARAQYLILSTSRAGDPVNANTPGSYVPGVAHAEDPSMAATSIRLGPAMTVGAQVWSTLPQPVLDRTVFVHHATLTNNHGNLPKVFRMMGATTRQEMFVSLYAKALAPCFQTVQVQPISAGGGSFLTFDGRALPNLPPRGLRDILIRPDSPLQRLQTLRDRSLDELNALLKQDGNAAQRRYLDELAQSRAQARSLSDDLLNGLTEITSDNQDGQIVAAVSLIRMNVTPVAVISLRFGGDNHADAGLMASEVPQHAAGVATIARLMAELDRHGLSDRVTFAMLNVFGRTLARKGTAGRDHWANHHVTPIIGKHVRAGVVGGLEPAARGEFAAASIDAATGRAVPGGGGDIQLADSLGALGKTLGAALGIDAGYLDQHITTGKIVRGALA